MNNEKTEFINTINDIKSLLAEMYYVCEMHNDAPVSPDTMREYHIFLSNIALSHAG